MILGVILLVIGYVAGIAILWTIGIIVIGVILWILGAVGRQTPALLVDGLAAALLPHRPRHDPREA